MSSILQMQLSFSKTLSLSSETSYLFLSSKLSSLSIHAPPVNKPIIIRMGGGPRTYPGGVSKWQWKRMQAKKAKQLLKARLCRERQIYEMRKRAELKAAVAELERPWEVVERAPNLFSVNADEQVKVLADRFLRPGGLDLWTEKDGPQLFDTVEGLPSARFFPKGVVHSVRPYGKIDESVDELGSEKMVPRAGENKKLVEMTGGVRTGRSGGGRLRRKRNRISSHSRQVGFDRKQSGDGRLMDSNGDSGFSGNSKGEEKSKSSGSEVYDLSLQRDGSYIFDT